VLGRRSSRKTIQSRSEPNIRDRPKTRAKNERTASGAFLRGRGKNAVVTRMFSDAPLWRQRKVRGERREENSTDRDGSRSKARRQARSRRPTKGVTEVLSRQISSTRERRAQQSRGRALIQRQQAWREQDGTMSGSNLVWVSRRLASCDPQ